ncbi:hypothetical protein F7734_47045 [Scytonema sp. UIC 10036]|uniref:hypothetical protein n=1 Tax=Scytonema sp. UIC 10036 TaxID=2304196 RepID=UPI0012DA66E8|nr:hypothetical protein [Scytonema sp. UIC 10036]MUG99449.1 hypothetical protein [Scytonema sp. UIC 10036]
MAAEMEPRSLRCKPYPAYRHRTSPFLLHFQDAIALKLGTKSAFAAVLGETDS